jgi:crotonyl-CoA reductase
VPIPPLGPNEVLIAPMASALNYNTVWTSIFEPVSTFGFLERYGRLNELGARHDLPYHIVGSDAAGVVLRRPGRLPVEAGRPGHRALQLRRPRGPQGHEDSMLDADQRIWGFETNFGSLADMAMVKANQLMPMPAHLTWEEAASLGLVIRPAYRMLVGKNAGAMKQGDVVLDLGRDRRARRVRDPVRPQRRWHPRLRGLEPGEGRGLRSIGASTSSTGRGGLPLLTRTAQPDYGEMRRFGKKIRELTVGQDPDIVFEHPGPSTFGASVWSRQARWHHRHLRLDLGLPAPVRQPLPLDAAQAHHRLALRQLRRGVAGQPAGRPRDDPPDPVEDLPLDRPPKGAYEMHHNLHAGKIGILVGAPEEGLGVRDETRRKQHLERIEAFRAFD